MMLFALRRRSALQFVVTKTLPGTYTLAHPRPRPRPHTERAYHMYWREYYAPTSVGKAAEHLLNALLQYSPVNRPRLQNLRSHPWVSADEDSPVDSIGVVDRSPEAMALRSALSAWVAAYGPAHSQYRRVTMEPIKE